MEGTSGGHLVQPHAGSRANFKARSGCSGLVLSTCDYFQGCRLYHLRGVLLQHFTILFIKQLIALSPVRISPYCNTSPLLLVLSLCTSNKSLPLPSLNPPSGREAPLPDPHLQPPPQAKQTQPPQLPLMHRVLQPSDCLGGLHQTQATLLTSLLSWQPRTGDRIQLWSHECQAEGIAASLHLHEMQCVAGLHPCKSILTTHVQSAVHQPSGPQGPFQKGGVLGGISVPRRDLVFVIVELHEMPLGPFLEI